MTRHLHRPRLLSRSSWPETQHVADILRKETIGGTLLVIGAAIALLWANSPWREAYAALRDFHVGIPVAGLDLSLGHWAADGLLAIFFLVAGLELKREFLVGELRTPAKAAVPVLAAFGGVLVPALVFLAVVTVSGADPGAARGWAIPTATDIAFALAVLALLGSYLPSGLRSFLLTLAVVDDLIAITIIAIFYTTDLEILPLLLAAVPLAGFAALTQRRITHWWLLAPLGLGVWVLILNSGVHATVAGVLLGLVVPVKPRAQVPAMSLHDRSADIAHYFEHRLRPVSAGVAIPLFAFFASGVTLVGGGLGAAARDPVAIGIVAGLVLGKLIGVLGTTFVLARFTRAELDEGLAWTDVFGLALLTGIGFTVSLLVGELAFGAGSDRDEHVKAGILVGSLLAALLATLVLRTRNAVYRRMAVEESIDENADGIPDIFQRDEREGAQ